MGELLEAAKPMLVSTFVLTFSVVKLKRQKSCSENFDFESLKVNFIFEEIN
jgi:hypothetical protein